jgi:TPR repeat protein
VGKSQNLTVQNKRWGNKMIRLILSIFLSACFFTFNAVASTESEKCGNLFNDGKYGQALVVCTKAADHGDATAQYYLGVMYYNGNGVKRDYAKSFKLYQKAADQGYTGPMYNLGMMLDNGLGVPRNHLEALRMFRAAADGGFAQAQYWLGTLYENGNGVEKDNFQAAEWYKKAADQGNAQAQTSLGYLLKEGVGIPKNYTEAVGLFKKAAEQGNGRACYILGLMHYDGEGVQVDYEKSCDFHESAAANNFGAGFAGLGMCYTTGEGRKEDFVKARQLFAQAKEAGYSDADSFFILLNKHEQLPVPERKLHVLDEARVRAYRKNDMKEVNKIISEMIEINRLLKRPKAIRRLAMFYFPNYRRVLNALIVAYNLGDKSVTYEDTKNKMLETRNPNDEFQASFLTLYWTIVNPFIKNAGNISYQTEMVPHVETVGYGSAFIGPGITQKTVPSSKVNYFKVSVSESITCVVKPGLGITSVTLPVQLQQQLEFMTKKHRSIFQQDSTVPFLNWMIENIYHVYPRNILSSAEVYWGFYHTSRKDLPYVAESADLLINLFLLWQKDEAEFIELFVEAYKGMSD